MAEPENLNDDAFKLVPASVARRDYLGGISPTTEWRWRQSCLDFPEPITIRGRNYYRVRELRRFISAREAA